MYTISKTPHRISLFGGSCDFESYYKDHGALLIGFAINQYCYIICRHTPEILPYYTSVSYSVNEKVKNNLDIKHNGVRGVLQYLERDDPIEIQILTDIPARTGLGSSSTFVVGMLNAAYDLFQEPLPPTDRILAKTAIYIERGLLNEPGGIQDQIWAAYGGVNSIEIEKDGKFHVKPLPVSREFLAEFRRHVLFLYTGVERQSFAISESTDTTEKKAIEKKRAIHDLAKMAYSAFADENIEDIGILLDHSWKMKRGVSSLISNDKIDDIYQTAIKNGAVGGKLLGSGGSGFMLFVCPPERQQKVIDSLGLTPVDFDFDFTGSQIIPS